MTEPNPDIAGQYLDRLRGWRNRPSRTRSLEFLADTFEREVARPHRQLGPLAAIWRDRLPEELADRTRLEGFQRGVLSVAVDSSSTLYELDRLLRSGLENELIEAFRAGSLRRIRLRLRAENTER